MSNRLSAAVLAMPCWSFDHALVELHASFRGGIIGQYSLREWKTPQAPEEHQNIWNDSSPQAQVL